MEDQVHNLASSSHGAHLTPPWHTALSLSAALLRTILMNHLVHSKASKNTKNIKTTLRGKVDDMDVANSKLEAELRK
jgi:hypothetical protein